jgi:inosine-uridine nucleoside N-ribohydrolase
MTSLTATISDRWLFLAGVVLMASLLSSATAKADPPSATAKLPVIFDTDIGDDIDDTWALVMLLKSPELDVKLVVGDHGTSLYRAKLLAKLLETAGRTDIPVGIGAGKRSGAGRQQQWVKDYDLDSYPGKVHTDGVGAMIDTIMASPEPVTVIAVGPVLNLRVALEREPRIAKRARFVGMHGSVRIGYGGSAKPTPEYNVRADVPSCQAVFTAPWDITITPLDTCGLVYLKGAKYAKVRDCSDPLVRALIENYRIWAEKQSDSGGAAQAAKRSSTLFDMVAVYLALNGSALCKMETLPIRVTNEGMTVIDPGAKKVHVATQWKDLGAFEDLLVKRLTGSK